MARMNSVAVGAMVAGLVAAAGLAIGDEKKAMTTPPGEKASEAAPARAAKKKLSIGDAAPEFSVNKWIKGEALTGLEKGRIYVVEFWGTWCPPCVTSIPHLTELQHKFQKDGVKFIGVTYNDKDVVKVENFVKAMGDKMDYAVAYDTGPMADSWYYASGRPGVPFAFVVDREGRIAWMGHPMGELESTLERMVAGTFDLEIEVAALKLMEEMAAAAGESNWKLVHEKINEMHALGERFHAGADRMRFMALLQGEQKADEAFAHFDKAIDGSLRNEPMALYGMSRMVLLRPEGEAKNVDVALKAASRANEITKGEKPEVLDTLALAYWEKGDAAKAVEFQEKAVEKAAEGKMKVKMEETLAKYRAGK